MTILLQFNDDIDDNDDKRFEIDGRIENFHCQCLSIWCECKQAGKGNSLKDDRMGE